MTTLTELADVGIEDWSYTPACESLANDNNTAEWVATTRCGCTCVLLCTRCVSLIGGDTRLARCSICGHTVEGMANMLRLHRIEDNL